MPHQVKDVIGAGEIVKQSTEFVKWLIKFLALREKRRLRNESLRLRNTCQLLQMAKDFERTPEEVMYYERLINEAGFLASKHSYFLDIRQYREKTSSLIDEAS